MKDNGIYDFFTQASRLILFIPVILLVVIIMVQWGGWGSPNKAPVHEETGTVRPKTIPTVTAVPFNLTGPFACDDKLQAGSVSAMIQNRNVVATVSAGANTQHFLLNGDCAYYWLGNAKTGVKKCGLGTMLSMAEGLLSTGLLSFDSLLSTSGLPQGEIKGSDIQSFMKSCKKSTAYPASLFGIPKGVKFTEKKE